MFKAIKEKFDQIDKKYIVGGLVGVAALGVGLYFFLRKKNPSEQPIEANVSKSAKTGTTEQVDDGNESDEKILIRVVNGLKKVIPDQNGPDYNGVKGIFKAQYQLSRKQFKELTLRNRKQRRKVLNSLNEYHKNVSEYMAGVDAIHNKHLNSLLAHFKIDEVEWVELTEEAALQHPDDWDTFILQNDNEEIDSIRNQSKPPLKLQMIIEMEKFRIAKLKEKIDHFKEVFADIDPTDLYNLVEKWGRDVVFQQFKVEEEDIQFSVEKLSEKDKETIEEYHQELRSLMESLIIEISEEGQEA